MQLNIGQHMKLSQQMKLAPRMIQSMEILQLPIMALKERIEQELRDNEIFDEPSPEFDTPEASHEREVAAVEAAITEKPLDQQELVVGSDTNNEQDFERLLDMAEAWPEEDFSGGMKPSSNRISDEMDRQHDVMSNMLERPQSLQQYLLEQFGFFNCPPVVREFGEYLIQNLDENGRLPSPLTEMVQIYGERISLDEAQQALDLLQRLDPPGVGARDYKECLLLQVKPDTPYRDVLITLISSHLEDLAYNRLPVIQRKTGYDIETIKAAHEQLLELNPFPGRGFEARPNQNVIPDLFVERGEQGQWVIRMDDEYTPRLHISKKYRDLLRGEHTDPKTKEYIKRKIESARWLMESIEQRQSTLRRVAQAIVTRQTGFLERGPEAITPLKMQQIADDVGVHVTTVSRAVDDKYVQTPRGIYALKRFFGGGTETADGEEVAWDIIRQKLKEIVDKEDKDDPLSDDALVEELKKVGYNLARRTVTKYRKALNIPSSRQRRQY